MPHGGEHFVWEIPCARFAEEADGRAHDQHPANVDVTVHQAVQAHKIPDVAHRIVIGDRGDLEEHWQAGGVDLRPECVITGIVERDVEPVAGERVKRKVHAFQSEIAMGAVKLRKCRIGEGTRLIDVQQGREFVRILVLGERVVIVHRAIAPPGLQDAVVDARIAHLGQHQFRRRHDLLHPDRHILGMIVLAVDREIETPIIAHPEVDVLEPRPRIVAFPEQHRPRDLLAVARPENLGRGPGLNLLDIFAVDLARRMTAGSSPVLEDMRVAIDNHHFLMQCR